MDTNCAGSRFVFYKDPINCQPNLNYNESSYGTTYPVEGDYKERRLYPSTGPLYYQHNYKAEVDYRENKALPAKVSYTNCAPGSLKDNNYYSYYDQYKYNLAPTTNYPHIPKTVHYQNHQTSSFSGVALPSTYAEETNLAIKSQLPKVSNSTFAAYNYPNYYGYSGPAYASQNYCNYNYSEEPRWDDYQNNRRLSASYVYPNRPVKDPSEMYRSNQFGYHTDNFYQRDKAMCAATNRALNSSSHCGNRTMWPMHVQYPAVTQPVMDTYDRLNYHTEPQNSNCCIVRHEKPSEYYQNYKYLATQHMPYRSNTTDTFNPYPQMVYNDRRNHDAVQQGGVQHLPDQNTAMSYKVETSEVPQNVYGQRSEISSNVESNYEDFQIYKSNNAMSQGDFIQDNVLFENNDTSAGTKKQNLREFLSSWNEDEDDALEKLETNLEGSDDLFISSSSVEVRNNGCIEVPNIENHYQFVKSRPKIHVGITVDSNVTNDQFINLPDIIIDIEKSKDPENIGKPENHSLDGNMVVFEPVDVSMSEFRSYKQFDFISTNEETEKNVETQETHEVKSKTPAKAKGCKRKKASKRSSTKSSDRPCACKMKKSSRSVLHKHACRFVVKKKRSLHLRKKVQKHSCVHNPKSLKFMCISVINTDEFHDYFMKYVAEEETDAINFAQDTKAAPHLSDASSVPKLSDLCENALSELYSNGLLVINIDEESNSGRIYVVECDINENVLDSADDIPLSYVEYTNGYKDSSEFPQHANEENSESQDIMKDVSSIHHEEIVPDNYKDFENKKFLEYLQNKYVRTSCFLKNYVTRKIVGKYIKRIHRKINCRYYKQLDQRN